MRAILDCESSRLAEQTRLDRLKTAGERNRWGQFATPPELSLEIARYAWNYLRRRDGNFCFLDPAVGTGSFFAAFRQIFPADRIELALGVELDEAFAEAAALIWRGQGLQVIHGDFTKQTVRTPCNVILTNPPYVRHHHLSTAEKRRLGGLARETTGLRLSGLAGLYCYFMLIAHAWLADNGLAVWLIPSEFMDVNYGDTVKRYLTEQVSLIRVHRFCPSDVQFDDALVSSAVVTFVKRKPSQNHKAVFSFGGTLSDPKRTTRGITVAVAGNQEVERLCAPPKNERKTHEVLLGDLFRVKRGIATGNNGFFIVPRSQLRQLGVPLDCVRPILPSPRFLRQEIVECGDDGWPLLDEPLALIDCSLPEEQLRQRWPKFWAYLEEGKRREHRSRIHHQPPFALVFARTARTGPVSLHLHGPIPRKTLPIHLEPIESHGGQRLSTCCTPKSTLRRPCGKTPPTFSTRCKPSRPRISSMRDESTAVACTKWSRRSFCGCRRTGWPTCWD